MKATFLILVFLVVLPLRHKDACKTSKKKHSVTNTNNVDPALSTESDTVSLAETLVNNGGGDNPDIIHNFLADPTGIGISESDENIAIDDNEKSIAINANSMSDNSGKDKKQPDYQFLIIGGGPQALILIARLSKSGLEAPFRIIIVETKALFGTGTPFDPTIATPDHLQHVFDLNAVATVGDAEEFMAWLGKGLHLDILTDNLESLKKSKPPNPLQRIFIGQYLTARFHHFVQQCRSKGYEITLINDTTAVTMSAHPGGSGYVVTLNRADPLHALDAFLATGHWDSSRFDHRVDGYYKSPWPANDLLNKVTGVKEDDIGVFGNGPPAIDALMTLAHKFGNFSEDYSAYGTCSKSSKFKVTMYSRGGELPIIKRSGKMYKYEPKYVSVLLMTGRNNRRTFDVIFGILKERLVKLLPSFPPKDRVDKMTAKEFFGHLDDVMKPMSDPRQNFLDDLENKLDHRYLDIQSVFFHSYHHYDHEYMKQFSAEEFITFKKYIWPRIEFAATRIPEIIGEKLRALIEAGCLVLQPIGNDYKITEKKDGRGGVTVKYGTHEPVGHDYFIDAAEQHGHIRKDPRDLTKSLLNSGLAQSRRFLFNNQEDAEKLFDGHVEGDGVDRSRIVKIEEKFYYEGDGVVMDMGTLHVSRRSGSNGAIYASAPFTFAYVRDTDTLATAARFADIAVKQMERERGIPGTEEVSEEF